MALKLQQHKNCYCDFGTKSKSFFHYPDLTSTLGKFSCLIISHLKMISSPYFALSRVCLRFCFVSCETSQNVNISQLLT